MIRGGIPGAIVRLGAPRPPSPDPRALEAAAKGPLRRAGTGKGDRKALNSKRRRFLADLEYAADRHGRTLRVLSDLAGLDEHSDAGLRLGRWLGALVLYAGLPAGAAADAWGSRDPVDWDVFADPAHALTGWVLSSGPTPEEALGVACSLPDPFARRLLEDHRGGIGAGRVLDADREALAVLGELAEPVLLARSLNDRAPLTLRTNTARATREELLAALDADGVVGRPARWTDSGVLVEGNPNVKAVRALKDGLADVQDEGSALIAELVDPQPGETIVDACAGAGGKALALAARMGEGTVLAADTRRPALDEARRRADRAGVKIGAVLLREQGPLPGRLEKLRGRADRVLLDVPCSSSGAVRRRPALKWTISDAGVARLAVVQAGILARFAPLVRPGGRLVYATCSLFSEENDDVVRRFLASPEGAAFSILPARETLGARADALGDGDVLRLLPHRHGTDGFYGVSLVRE